jgi:hypothetical protein
MAKRIGYLVDVTNCLLFSDSEGGTWIQAMGVGTYHHPVYGDLDFSQQRLQAYANSVNNRILQKEPDIDYEHKMGPQGGIAAGWVKQAQVRDNGLWLYVTWTPQAQQKLKDGEYRYFSPEFDDEWTDPKSQVTYKDVLFGGALTNRPFQKDLVPINLSEMVGATMGNDNNTNQGGSPPPTDAQNLTEMAKALGLTGQVTSAQILSELGNKLAAQNTTPPVQLNIGGNVQPPPPGNNTNNANNNSGDNTGDKKLDEGKEDETGKKDEPKSFTELAAGLSMSDLLQPVPTVDDKGNAVALSEVVAAQNKKLQGLQIAAKLADAQNRVTQLSDRTSGEALSPIARELAVELLVKAPAMLSEPLTKFLELVAAGRATVMLGEMGRARHGDSSSVIKQFTDRIAAVQRDDKVSYSEAVDRVSLSDPALVKEYMDATMSGEGDTR